MLFVKISTPFILGLIAAGMVLAAFMLPERREEVQDDTEVSAESPDFVDSFGPNLFQPLDLATQPPDSPPTHWRDERPCPSCDDADPQCPDKWRWGG